MEDFGPSPRVIGHYRGTEAGPLVIAIGGLHGNEPAGVLALERLFELLEEEPRINPGFTFRGELLALRGNLAALSSGKRYLDVDLNRIWEPRRRDPQQTFGTAEEAELDGLLAAIEHVVDDDPISPVVLLDLHTTTADGGIFTITSDDQASLNLAAELSVPVIKGMFTGLTGTTLHYFRGQHFGHNRPSRGITFEAGQHDDPASADRALAATVALLRAVGCVRAEDVSTEHDTLLRESTHALPRFTELAYVHRIYPGRRADFEMAPGYRNFQPVHRGEQLAKDHNGPIAAPCDGYLLMPLYQEQGEEGFFIVRDYRPGTAY